MVASLFRDFQSHLNHFFESVSVSDIEDLARLLSSCNGTLFLTGIGKSGHIARKIAATLVSTGTPSIFLSPDHALHGDIGLIGAKDICLFFSKSGESEELLRLMYSVRKKGAKVMCIVSAMNSRLAKEADKTIYLPVARELCPYDLAPTVSSAAQLIFGDCLAITLMQKKRFTVADFALNHPAGMLGRKITLKVSDMMLRDDALPLCGPKDLLIHVLPCLSEKRCGCLLVVEEKSLLGIFTDGDLRRAIEQKKEAALHIPMEELMTISPRTITSDALAIHALKQMEEDPKRLITALPVVDQTELKGLIRMHDILQEGLH